jgi:hypothetical protein
VLEVLFLGAEGFSFSLGVLYGGLGISKLQLKKKKNPAETFFSKFGYQIQNPGSGSAIRKNAGSGIVSSSNQCGSENLL